MNTHFLDFCYSNHLTAQIQDCSARPLGKGLRTRADYGYCGENKQQSEFDETAERDSEDLSLGRQTWAGDDR